MLNQIKTKISLTQKILEVLRKLLGLQKELEKKNKGGFEEFALALRMRESSNNYKAVNPYGFLGAYQFGMARLSDLGYAERKPNAIGYSNYAFTWKSAYTKEYFLDNPDFQDRVFKEHCRDLIDSIKPKWGKYFGKTIDFVNDTGNKTEITLSGCVAYAHLAGIGGLGYFLEGLGEKSDAFGTKGSDYLKEFAGYNLLNI